MDVNHYKAPSVLPVFQGPPNTHVLLGGAKRNSLGVRAGRMPRSCQSGEIPGALHCVPSVRQALARWHFLEQLQVLSTLPSLLLVRDLFPWTESPPQARAGAGRVWRQQGRRTEGQEGEAGRAAGGPGSRLQPAAHLRHSDASLLIVSIQPHVRVARSVRGAWPVFPEPEL